jgi:hypothetical protein
MSTHSNPNLIASANEKHRDCEEYTELIWANLNRPEAVRLHFSGLLAANRAVTNYLAQFIANELIENYNIINMSKKDLQRLQDRLKKQGLGIINEWADKNLDKEVLARWRCIKEARDEDLHSSPVRPERRGFAAFDFGFYRFNAYHHLCKYIIKNPKDGSEYEIITCCRAANQAALQIINATPSLV